MTDDPFPVGMLDDISKFFKDVHPKLQPNQDYYPEVFETGLFFPLQRQAELREMIREARSIKPKIVFEIGCDKGGSLYHWCQCLQSTIQLVIGCEIRGTPYRELFEERFRHIDFIWRERSSYDPATVQSVDLALGDEEIDILFIDGDKGAYLKDFEFYLPLMSPNGIVFMHDVTDSPEPKNAFKLVSDRYRTRLIHDISDWEREEFNEEQGRPPRTPHDAWLRTWRGRSCGVGVAYLNSEGK